MTANGCYFVEWKEDYVSQERGKRVVHYFLKDSLGVSVLAVIGTERSLRHMFYVVADDFLRVCGEDQHIQAGFKWRSRREVVDWLTSMLSKQHLFRDRKVGGPQSQSGYISDYMGRLGRNFREQCSDISWSGTAWTCGKQLKHYPSFCRNGISIKVQSFVFIMAEERDGYLAYLEDMYEDRKGQQKVKVRWFHHHQEVKGVVPLRSFHPKEVFITPYAQVLSAECVDGLAIVLTPEHYEQCLGVFPAALLGRVHVCFRQFKSNRVKPFDLSNLHGYFDQAIFSCLNPDPVAKLDVEFDLMDKEDEDLCPWHDERKGSKRPNGGRGPDKFVKDHSGPRNSIKDAQIWADDAPYEGFRNRHSLKRPCLLKNFELSPCNIIAYNVDDEIEVLSQDSGIRGCWFNCTVVQVSRKQLKVQYNDVQDEEGGENLEEWIPAFRIAKNDPLGMRFLGRPTVRPALLRDVHVHQVLNVGDAIDARWNDGWWEGVVTNARHDGRDIAHIYLPGENLHLTMPKKDLRISKDWTGNQWVDVDAKPEICTIIPTASSDTDPDLSIISSGHKDVRPVDIPMPSKEARPSTKLYQAEIENGALILSSTCEEDLDRKAKISQLEDPIDTEFRIQVEQPQSQLELNGEAEFTEFRIQVEQPQSQLELNGEAEFKTSVEQPHYQIELSGEAEHRAITLNRDMANIEEDIVRCNIDDKRETVKADSIEDELVALSKGNSNYNESCINHETSEQNSGAREQVDVAA